MIVLFERQRTYEGLEAVDRKTQNIGSGSQGGDCEKNHRTKGTTDHVKEEKLFRNKILCRSGSGDKAHNFYRCSQGECGGRINHGEAKEISLLLGGLVGRRNVSFCGQPFGED